MGSYRYAQKAKRDGEDISAMICLESIGYYGANQHSQSYPFGLSYFYPSRANFIAAVSNLASTGLLKQTVKILKRNCDLPVEYLVGPIFLAPAISFSDHWAFWKFGYKAVMITDTAFYRNPFYHTSSDSAEKLNYRYIAELVKGVYAVLLKISQ